MSHKSNDMLEGYDEWLDSQPRHELTASEEQAMYLDYLVGEADRQAALISEIIAEMIESNRRLIALFPTVLVSDASESVQTVQVKS
jgi:hypothetical protein